LMDFFNISLRKTYWALYYVHIHVQR